MASPAPKLVEETTTEIALCYLCDTPLDGDLTVCSECGHRQYRVCYCGERLRPDLAICPKCEADWSESSRVKAKRKSRSHGSLRGLLRSSIGGAVVFAAVCGVLYLAGGRAAQALGAEVPASILVRLWYLGRVIVGGLVLLCSRCFGFLSSVHVLQLLALIVVGAVLGAAWYMLRHGRWVRAKLSLQKAKRRRAV